MKIITTNLVFLLFAFCLSSQAMKAPDNPQEATEWYQAMDKGVDKWTTATDKNVQIENLGEYVRKLGRRMPDHLDPRWHETFRKAQTALLAIPGHAQHFADKIEREQEAVESYPTSTGPRVSYDFNRSLCFETLSHLPSPETISVLGDLLSDDADTPRPLMSPGSDWGGNPRANSFFSAGTIMMIGLRNPPAARELYDADPEQHLAKTRAWWEEIKAGKNSFSFIGQKVEYRFKPDGTWDTLALANAPDDAPKQAKLPTPVPSAIPTTAGQSLTLWIIAAAVVFLVGLVWLVLKRRS